MSTITTHCALRLGDNLSHLHFLRKLAEKSPGQNFVHYAHSVYLPQLRAMVADMPQIILQKLPPGDDQWNAKPAEPSINAWKNADGWFDRQAKAERNLYSWVTLNWFSHLAHMMLGVFSPLRFPSDLLFDYPALRHESKDDPIDFLIVNSPPMSGQARHYNQDEMDKLIVDLRAKGYTTLATSPSRNGDNFPNTQAFGWDVTQIGHISQCCKRIIAVATGPIWPTFNVWNAGKLDLRIVINEPEIVDLDPSAIHAKTVSEVRAHLKERALL